MPIASARGQSAFSPPPRPTADPSMVRGLGTSAQLAPSGPTAIAPAPTVAPPSQQKPSQSATPSPVTPPPVTPMRVAPAGVQPIEGGEIIAKVDGQIVLASDILWQVDQLIAANRSRIPEDRVAEARRALMRQQLKPMLDTKMLYADFRRKVPAENIPGIFDNLRQPFNESEVPRLVKMLKLEDQAELEQILRKSGTSIADVRRQFYERTIASEWLRQMTEKPKEVTHEELLAYYQEHTKDYEYPAQAKWEEVMIRIDRTGNDRTAAWKEIAGLGNEIWQRVSKSPGLRGPIFTEIAKTRSHGYTADSGGQHEWTTKGALVSQEIDEALFTLKVGQLSNIIESDRGFHIIRVLERKEAGRTPFTEAQAEIRKILKNEQRQGLSEVQLVKLRKKSRVWTVFDGNLTAEQLNGNSGAVRR